MKKKLKVKTFVCEICHCITPISCEGSEPNTCAMCMPIKVEKDKVDGYGRD
jgi:hypothetical protein